MQAYLDGSKLDASTVDSYVELHIEQGPLLEADNRDVGIVTHIFGPSLTHVIFNGSGGHAGGMPMAYRCGAEPCSTSSHSACQAFGTMACRLYY